MIQTAEIVLMRQAVARARVEKISTEFDRIMVSTLFPLVHYYGMVEHIRRHQFDGMTAG